MYIKKLIRQTIYSSNKVLVFSNKKPTIYANLQRFSILNNKMRYQNEEKEEKKEKKKEEEKEEKKEESKYKSLEEAIQKIKFLEENLEKNRVKINILINKKEMRDKYLQSLAEMENTRRIAKEDVDKAKKFALNNFATSLLEVADNLNLAIISYSDKINQIEDKTLKNFLQGVVMTEKILMKVFAHHQIKPIEDPLHKKFDPQLHEAVIKEPNPDLQNDTVSRILKRGYYIHDRVLRPTNVVVVENDLNPPNNNN
jgi:molecular chaperone GrpE